MVDGRRRRRLKLLLRQTVRKQCWYCRYIFFGRRADSGLTQTPLQFDQMYRRPETYEQAFETMSRATATASPAPGGTQETVVAMSRRLLECDWWPNAMKPLYHKNLVVSFSVNTLVPTCVELMLDERSVNELEEREDNAEHRLKRRHDRLRAKLRSIERAIQGTRGRSVTPEFRSMTDAMLSMCTEPEVVTGLCQIYGLMKTARSVLDVFCDRLTKSLEEDSAIRESTDIPLELLMLGN